MRIKCNLNQQKNVFCNEKKREKNGSSDMALDICGRKNIHIVIACTRLF